MEALSAADPSFPLYFQRLARSPATLTYREIPLLTKSLTIAVDPSNGALNCALYRATVTCIRRDG